MKKQLLMSKLENVMIALKELDKLKNSLPESAIQKLIPLKEAYIKIKPEFDKQRNKINDTIDLKR